MSNEQARSVRPRGTIAALVFGVVILAVVLWQFAGVAGDGRQIQVLDPGLGVVWKALIVAFVVVDLVCSIAVWVLRKWTVALATVNAVAALALAGLITVLTLTGELFASTLPAQVGGIFDTNNDLGGLVEPFLLFVAAIALWDSVDGARQARRPART